MRAFRVASREWDLGGHLQPHCRRRPAAGNPRAVCSGCQASLQGSACPSTPALGAGTPALCSSPAGSSGRGADQKAPRARPCHQGNITLLWNEVISSSPCEEMGIYVTVGMVFIFPNFQITFD